MHDFPPHLGGGAEENNGVNGELGVDDHVADQDGDGVQEPAVQPDHQHSRYVHLERRSNKLINNWFS